MNEKSLNSLLDRTAKFRNVIHDHVGCLVPAEGKRFTVAFQAALLSLEHGLGGLVLFNAGIYPSAYSLMRPQYESLVRGVWLLYAASETWVEKLSEPLTLENATRAKDGESVADMLKSLQACERAPAHVVKQLIEYKEVTWKALNSYTHGGLHPLARTLTGYPEQLSYDVLRNSNAKVALAAQLAAILTNDQRNMEPIRQMHVEFADCLPPLSNI